MSDDNEEIAGSSSTSPHGTPQQKRESEEAQREVQDLNIAGAAELSVVTNWKDRS
jgi:hypothetical protein